MHRIVAILFLLHTPLLLAADGEEARRELKALQGTWKMVGGEAAGMAFPKDSVPDFTMVIATDGKCTGRTPGGEFRFTMTVDPTKNPRTFENLQETGPEKGKKQYGIYKLEGDKFTVCLTRAGSPEANRPKEFATKDSTNVLFIFERVKEDKKP